MSISHYQRVISLLPEAALIVTPSGRIIAANRSGKELLDRHRVALGSVFDGLRAESRQDAVDYLRLCARSGQPLVGSFVFEDQAGANTYTSYGALLEPRSEDREAMMLFRLHPRNENNAKFSSLKRQIDELNKEVARRQRAEYQLKNQTQWLEITLTSIGDAVITTDSENRVAFMNPIAEAMTGWNLREALGQPLSNVFVIINEYTGAPVESPAEIALRERTMVELANHTVLVSKHGKHTAIEDTAAPIMLDDDIKGVILVFHDVSDRRLLEHQLMERAETLERANRRKNQFLTMLAHELRSPLAPISNAVQVMKLQCQQPEATEVGPRQVIERQVQHLKRLIDDMLDVSRIISGKMNIVRKNVNLTSLVRCTCDDFQPRFQQSSICFHTSLPPTDIYIHADADRIVQVIHNLLTNAAKFTPAGGSTSVSLRVEGGLAILQVTDTGIGIDESVMADLFEPFTQAEQSLDRSEGGLGLGLSLVKGIVDLHHGEASVVSKGRHQGSSFTIKLLLADVENQANEEKAAVRIEQTHRILLIEDEKDAAETMGQLLELLGHEVHLAHTGPEGLKKATAVKPTLIICDIGLPGLDGFEVAEQLRQRQVTSAIPLVALTGYGAHDFVDRAKTAGFDHHMTKPASINDIQDALAIADSSKR